MASDPGHASKEQTKMQSLNVSALHPRGDGDDEQAPNLRSPVSDFMLAPDYAIHVPSFHAATYRDSSTSSMTLNANQEGGKSKQHEKLLKGDNLIILSCVSLTVFLMYFGISLPISFLPSTVTDLGASLIEVGILFGIFPFASTIFVPAAGWLCMRFGRLPVLFVGLNVMGISMVLFGLMEENLALLFIMRACQGIGGALAAVAATSVLTNEFRDHMGEAMGIREMFAGVAFVLGPTFGGILYEAGGFKLPFFLIGSIKIICSFPFAWAIKHAIRRNRARRCNQGRDGQAQLDDDSAEKGGAAGLTFGDVVSLTTVVAAVVLCLPYVGFSFTEPQLEEHLNRVLALSAGEVGGLYAIMAFFYSITAIWAGRAVRRYDAKAILMLGILLGVVALLILGPVPGVQVPSVGLMWFIQVLFMVSLGLSGGLLITTSYVILEHTIPKKPGQPEMCSSILQVAEGLTSSIIPVIGGALVAGLPHVTDNCYAEREEGQGRQEDAEECASGVPWASTFWAIIYFTVFLLVVFLLPSQKHIMSPTGMSPSEHKGEEAEGTAKVARGGGDDGHPVSPNPQLRLPGAEDAA